MTASSDNGTSTTTTIEFNTEITEKECKAEWTTTGTAFTDTLSKVTWERGISGWNGAICGVPSFSYAQNYGQSSVVYSQATTGTAAKQLQTVSQTGDYNMLAMVTYSNWPDLATDVTGTPVSWIQGCQVQISELKKISTTKANNETGAVASVTFMTSGVHAGDCGGAVSVGIVLTGADGAVFTIP